MPTELRHCQQGAAALRCSQVIPHIHMFIGESLHTPTHSSTCSLGNPSTHPPPLINIFIGESLHYSPASPHTDIASEFLTYYPPPSSLAVQTFPRGPLTLSLPTSLPCAPPPRSMARDYVQEAFHSEPFLAMHVRPSADDCIDVREERGTMWGE